MKDTYCKLYNEPGTSFQWVISPVGWYLFAKVCHWMLCMCICAHVCMPTCVHACVRACVSGVYTYM